MNFLKIYAKANGNWDEIEEKIQGKVTSDNALILHDMCITLLEKLTDFPQEIGESIFKYGFMVGHGLESSAYTDENEPCENEIIALEKDSVLSSDTLSAAMASAGGGVMFEMGKKAILTPSGDKIDITFFITERL